jgi:sporulation protein YlmC with PRC-barrel domain
LPASAGDFPVRHDKTRERFKGEELAMYGNIVTLVMQSLTPDVVGKIARAAGISDAATAQKAIGASVPSILAGLAGVASKPNGGQQLADAIARQPADTLQNLTNLIGGRDQTGLSSNGGTLSTLLGGGAFDALASAIGRFSGVGETAARSVLGMLTPIVMGMLRQEAGPGTSALTQLLASQKDSFTNAIPAGIADVFKTRPDGFGSTASTARRATPTYIGPRDQPDDPGVPRGTERSNSSSNWAYWVLPLAALAGLTAFLLSGDNSKQRGVDVQPRQAVTTPQTSPTAPSTASLASGDIQQQITSAVGTLSKELQRARSGTLADVLPNLQKSAGEFDRLNAIINRLPLDTREKLAENVKTAIANAKTELDRADQMPTLSPDGKVKLLALRRQLDTLAITPGALAQLRGAGAIEKVIYLARTPEGGISLSTYFDRNVLNGPGEKIGAVKDLIIGPDARITHAIIGVGGFLGIGEKEVAIPFAVMQLERRDAAWHLVVDATKDALVNAPAYQETGERAFLKPELVKQR